MELTFDEMMKDIASESTEQAQVINTAKEISKVIGALIAERVRMGMTQSELAERCGLKQSAIARMESLQAIPRLDTIIKAASGLGKSFEIKGIETNTPKIDNVIYFHNPGNTYNWKSGNNSFKVAGDLRNGTVG